MQHDNQPELYTETKIIFILLVGYHLDRAGSGGQRPALPQGRNPALVLAVQQCLALLLILRPRSVVNSLVRPIAATFTHMH